ncbi:MAG TPA: hypothetical protein DHW71_07790, partial [Gammaproteobacteria bacterium]|nr:hypothetical protein [Gammaproteobacteria bacterium]
ADAYYNMGVALKERGKLQEAIEAYNKALSIKPDYADAYYNMGNTLKKRGKLKEAIEAYKKALAIKPDNADAYYNMGNTLKKRGKLKEAIEAYKRALAIKPDNADAYTYNNMGIALKERGKLKEAIEAYKRALAIKPDYAGAYINMGNALKGFTFKKPSPSLHKIITSLLDKKSYVRPNTIARAVISLLKFEPNMQKHLQPLCFGKVGPYPPQEIIAELSRLPLLLKLMSVCPLPDLELENLFIALRASLLSSISSLKGSPTLLRFQSALALQCFTNEYIYKQSEHEEKALTDLEASIRLNLSNGCQPSAQYILCLASYKALNQYEWCDLLSINDDIEEVLTRQIIEPKQEKNLKANIPVLEEITDKVSSKVREQYEASPYPRWVDLGLRLEPAPIFEVINELKLKLFHPSINNVEFPNILIAGCGTGQHSIETAARLKGSKVLAIDLSLSSLVYARRKTEELGIQNIDYMQADILELGKLDKQFDIVESVGVLHHIDDPVAGWRVLKDCLKPGGLMKIGLYSELARQPVVAIREEIRQSGIGLSDLEMKLFRTMVMHSNKNHHKRILSFHDFYSLSELKDLLFHVQEHRFSIPQIQDCIAKLELKFCGFEADIIIDNFKLTNPAEDDLYNLDKWQAYEESNPRTFTGMYQFWCQKVAIS